MRRLEGELLQVMAAPVPPLPAEASERWELLRAVAASLRTDLARLRRGSIDRLERADIQFGLLWHLSAAGPRRQVRFT